MDWDREKERKAGKAYHMGSSVFGLIFSIFWCLAACSMGAWFMLIFGLPFVGMMLFRLVMCAKYTEEKPQQPSQDSVDPWERPTPHRQEKGNGFCPYCGSGVEDGFEYCPKCGRKLN